MDIAKRTVVYNLPGMERVLVRRDGELTIYGESRSAVIIVNGYPDAGFERFVGCKFMNMGWTTSWARLLAVSGAAAITYTTTKPEDDLAGVLARAREQFDDIALLATSGHGPIAVSMLDRVDRAALITAYTTNVPVAARAFGFVVPEKVSIGCPLFIARGGRDEMPGLNETLDAFVEDALRANVDLTLVNQANGSHAFDLSDDSDETRRIVKLVLRYLTSS
jgi:hypothetical protein